MTNMVASIRARLLNMAKKEQIPSKDIDLLGVGKSGSEAFLQEILTEASKIEMEDGLGFDSSTIEAKSISGQTEHGGIRALMTGSLGNARTRLQIDMGFGDIITGGPENRPYRTLLGNRDFSIQSYSDETAAAEKLEALVSRGTVNSRYKDLYDLFELLIQSGLKEEKVINAAGNTFANRKTVMPELPESLSEKYWLSESFKMDWGRYLTLIGASEPNQIQLLKTLLPKLQRIYKSIRTGSL